MLISDNPHFAFGVDTTLLNKHFAVVIVAVGVVSVPSYSCKFPPTVIRVRCVSALLGRMLHTIFGYVTFFVSNGTSSFGIKYIVLVPSIQFCTPWVKRPNSLASDFVHIFFVRSLEKVAKFLEHSCEWIENCISFQFIKMVEGVSITCSD